MRSVRICSRNDAINNVLVIGAGLAVLWSGSGLPDLLTAFIMAALGITGGWQIVRQAAGELRSEVRAPRLSDVPAAGRTLRDHVLRSGD